MEPVLRSACSEKFPEECETTLGSSLLCLKKLSKKEDQLFVARHQIMGGNNQNWTREKSRKEMIYRFLNQHSYEQICIKMQNHATIRTKELLVKRIGQAQERLTIKKQISLYNVNMFRGRESIQIHES